MDGYISNYGRKHLSAETSVSNRGILVNRLVKLRGITDHVCKVGVTDHSCEVVNSIVQ